MIDKYQFEEGYCQATPLYWEGKPFAETFTFCYYDQDHLGNIRQVTEADGSKQGEVIQRMNYYPFGAEFCDNSTKSYVQNHKYNGKEFDNMHGLNTYDYGARQYNPVTGRWDRMDPHCESYYNVSPYVYANNNPVMLVDLDGMDWYSRTDENGAVIYQYFDGSDEIEGWTNIGANHTVTCGNITYNYEQNEMVSMTESVLNENDWSSQMANADGKKKSGQEGNCFYQAGKMVERSGATSLGSTEYNVLKEKEKLDNRKMQSYIDSQIDCGYSVRVHVDRKNKRQSFDGNGDHWVAISSRTTNFRTNETYYNYYDPGTYWKIYGTSSDNCFQFRNNCWTAPGPNYKNNHMRYNIVNVRRNKR